MDFWCVAESACTGCETQQKEKKNKKKVCKEKNRCDSHFLQHFPLLVEVLGCTLESDVKSAPCFAYLSFE